jgi:hypothetical protein
MYSLPLLSDILGDNFHVYTLVPSDEYGLIMTKACSESVCVNLILPNLAHIF